LMQLVGYLYEDDSHVHSVTQCLCRSPAGQNYKASKCVDNYYWRSSKLRTKIESRFKYYVECSHLLH
jgi:hypothetical protein